MTIKQIITLKTDLIDCETTEVKVVSMDRVITHEDTKLLEYLFKTNFTDSYGHHDISIEIVDDVAIELSENQVANMFAFEKNNGVFNTKTFQIPVVELSYENVQSNLTVKTELHDHYDNSFSSQFSDEENATFIFDLCMAETHESLDSVNKQDTFIGKIIVEQNLSTFFLKNINSCMNSEGQRVSMATYFFPNELIVVEHQATCISFDEETMKETFTYKVNIVGENNNLISQVSYSD